MNENEINVNGKVYALKNDAEKKDGMEYVIIRTCSAGVFAGYLKERKGKESTILDARRLWQWKGAASLSQLAEEGTSDPDGCKFPQEVKQIIVTETIEILSVTEKAKNSIINVGIWKV